MQILEQLQTRPPVQPDELAMFPFAGSTPRKRRRQPTRPDPAPMSVSARWRLRHTRSRSRGSVREQTAQEPTERSKRPCATSGPSRPAGIAAESFRTRRCIPSSRRSPLARQPRSGETHSDVRTGRTRSASVRTRQAARYRVQRRLRKPSRRRSRLLRAPARRSCR